MPRLLPYLVASSNARALDARGVRPGLFLRLLVLLPALLMLLFCGGVALLVAGLLVGHFVFGT